MADVGKPKTDKPDRHMRRGPALEVAKCGDREDPNGRPLVFVLAGGLITCKRCRAIHFDPKRRAADVDKIKLVAEKRKARSVGEWIPT